MSRDARKVRYGVACALIVIGFACGAISTGTVGGALATVFIAAGMLLFVASLLRDLGLSDRTGRPGRRDGAVRPPSSPGPSGPPPPSPSASSPPEGPRATARGHAAVRRPERLRGERRRLR